MARTSNAARELVSSIPPAPASGVRVRPDAHGAYEPPHAETVDCLGVPVARARWEALRDWFHTHARIRGRARVLHFANAHTLNLAWSDPSFRAVLTRADVVLNDGIGLDLYARLVGERFEKNFNGTDLVPALLEHATAGAPLRIFLFGGVPGRAEEAARVLEARFPGVIVVGTRHGYAHDGALEAINAASPDVLLVGMGNPIQEKWVDAVRHTLDVGIAMGVGALIDFLSGRVARAPRWVRAARLEWLYRLAREPKRLFRRYVLGNPAFLARALVYAARRPRVRRAATTRGRGARTRG